MKANWKLKNLLSVINIKIISQVCALQVYFGMLIKSEYKGFILISVVFEYHWLNFEGQESCVWW